MSELVSCVPFSESETIPLDSLTACQTQALQSLDQLMTEGAKIGILKGYAGTGKTYLSALMIRHLQEQGWNVEVMTPTGRAAKVLSLAMKELGTDIQPKTIHSAIYSIHPQDFSKGQASLFADTSEGEFFGPTFIIIDESSMVGDRKTERKEEGLHFGSGSLLHDILEYANLDNEPYNRILFIGDPGQLPPVMGDSRSPALNAEDIAAALPPRTAAGPIAGAELLTIVRQKEGSLREFVTDIRSAMRSGAPLPRNARQDARPLLPANLVPTYLHLTREGGTPHSTMVLAHRNRDVIQYNLDLRQALKPNATNAVEEGDILLVRRNVRLRDNGELDISSMQEDLKNGTFVRVCGSVTTLPSRTVAVHGKAEVTLRFVRCSLEFLSASKPQPIEVVLVTNMLERDYWQDYRRNYHHLEVGILTDFKHRMLDKYGWAAPKPKDSHYAEYSREAKGDKWLNALRVCYGYAVTVHNAQGGEWDNVIIDPDNPARDWEGERYQSQYKRWVYTASTRAKKRLWFIKRSVLGSTVPADLPLKGDGAE